MPPTPSASASAPARHALATPIPREGAEIVRVALGGEDPLGRRAIGAALGAPGIELIAAGRLGELPAALAGAGPVDAVVIDAQGAAVAALLALPEVHARAPRSKVLVLSTPASTDFGLLCLRLGASGFVSKEIDLASLPRLLRRLCGGEAVVSRDLATHVIERMRRIEPVPPRAQRPITPAEHRILELIQAGCDEASAAAELGVAPATIRRHLASARRKLAAHRPGSGGASQRSGGASPRSGGASQRPGGASPRSGGASQRSGGAPPRSGGASPRSASWRPTTAASR